jgi:hypothetical protein
MWQPNNAQWWLLIIVALLIVFVWPPSDDRSLAVKFVNWAVDPRGELPILPDQLALGLGDDPDAVRAHDMQTQQYDALYLKGGWTRRRLELKVARDPLNPATERQLLTMVAVVTAFIAWRISRK